MIYTCPTYTVTDEIYGHNQRMKAATLTRDKIYIQNSGSETFTWKIKKMTGNIKCYNRKKGCQNVNGSKWVTIRSNCVF
jgi:hypothetical protein